MTSRARQGKHAKAQLPKGSKQHQRHHSGSATGASPALPQALTATPDPQYPTCLGLHKRQTGEKEQRAVGNQQSGGTLQETGAARALVQTNTQSQRVPLSSSCLKTQVGVGPCSLHTELFPREISAHQKFPWLNKE